MTSKNSWLSPLEVAEHFAIHPFRVAQLMRTGLLPYSSGSVGPLVHSRNLKLLPDLFPDLLRHFQGENEVDNPFPAGGNVFDPDTCLRPSSVKLLKCVQRAQGVLPR